LAVIKDATSCPTAAGRVVEDVWNGLPDRFGVAPDQFIVMPNHVHGIVQITGESVSLGEIVRSFKAATTRMIRQAGMTDFAWQASYYEHIIRNEHELERIRNYIVSNPLMWNDDPENPSRLNSGGLSTIEPPWAR
jgi:REP element-mobilizing transposase RayT